MLIGGSPSGALFSDSNKKYRYALWRFWDTGKGAMMFVGLNPSTANEIQDDPTIRKLIGIAKHWNYGGLYAGNLFSLVTPNPVELFLKSCTEQPGGPNEEALRQMKMTSDLVMVGWGHEGVNAGNRPEAVLRFLNVKVYCLGTTKSGEPKHPLYLPKNTPLRPYYRKNATCV